MATLRGVAAIRTMEPAGNPVFERPPIIELGIGVFFRPVSALTVATLGRFWAEVAREFPKSEDHSPVGTPQDWALTKEGLPLPRLWLIEKDETALMQLQTNRFYLNWRKRPEGKEYPLFAAHLTRFLSHWSSFCRFVVDHTGEQIQIRDAEVLKVSVLEEGMDWQTSNGLTEVFPALALNNVPGNWSLSEMAFSVSMTDESVDGEVRVSIKTRLPTPEASRSAVVLEIRSKAVDVDRIADDTIGLGPKLSEANHLANRAFTSITSPKVQTDVWRRRN